MVALLLTLLSPSLDLGLPGVLTDRRYPILPHHRLPGEMASRLTTILRNQEIAGSTPAAVIPADFFPLSDSHRYILDYNDP
jgi:hypothetical protein